MIWFGGTTSEFLPGRPGELLQPMPAEKATIANVTRMGRCVIADDRPRHLHLFVPQPQSRHERRTAGIATSARALVWKLRRRRRHQTRSAKSQTKTNQSAEL